MPIVRSSQDEAAALWLAPLAATVPLILACSFPASPYFLGRLMDDPTHPMNRPLISALAVLFDGELLGVLVACLLVVPAHAFLRGRGRNCARNVLILCAAAGIAASQFARMIAQGFRQPDLRAFANSAASPILGCLCGLAGGICIAYFVRRRIPRALVWSAPVAALLVSAVALVRSAQGWHGR